MSINKVILVGNVGKDPDVKYFDNGSVVANFTLATTERGYTAANGTQIPDRTEWHNIVCWRGLAKVAEQFVRKGVQVYVEGKIRSRTYDDANGVKRYVNEIYADNLELLGSRRREEGETYPAQQPAVDPYNSINNYNTQSNLSEEDDLPF
ncbi:single-strand DNA-binding protein [Dysgonomonas sp. PFB1-18]|uniref:single-stranded DNA-binding protein n=1 Tax=unclassified Dysgonomonas TaxID=2630389 RepID=UPI002473B8BC|nr:MULTISPECIES: single-stranded DNA-binding protein [unclassified Dysgonomonas]MDH6310838.1 single-strand DNA-binding protein [Dysgonomonas sp. PF1-14]MDH6340724.1 single-strand DNA-binding protein [Dysgonomonas sp. PF1-16]MDH6382308.1 single-strand DNA-binding protein [Dysgonomonas sp. PFB1-18]MDH6399658.1 single-strand DNA-binding protein [Dysgonomonas sp. PF1-23]